MIVFEFSFQYRETIMTFYTEVITAWLSIILTTLITLYICNWVL